MDADFHLPHYECMEKLSCHSNQKTLATAKKKKNKKKKTLFVEANDVNNSTKFQLFPPTASEEMILNIVS